MPDYSALFTFEKSKVIAEVPPKVKKANDNQPDSKANMDACQLIV